MNRSVKSIERNIEKRYILTYSIEKSFSIDPLTTDNAIYRDSLILSTFPNLEKFGMNATWWFFINFK